MNKYPPPSGWNLKPLYHFNEEVLNIDLKNNNYAISLRNDFIMIDLDLKNDMDEETKQI